MELGSLFGSLHHGQISFVVRQLDADDTRALGSVVGLAGCTRACMARALKARDSALDSTKAFAFFVHLVLVAFGLCEVDEG